ncbi:CAAX protease self-immunity [Nocardiopsis flavescens]|uniref:CAAX protease self-immunity n=2 Tax=Nocardiopsis flavescens TaxID=758803 RepID=A0A1M6CGR1_9ACTN|nr:CAAX protease self-immunity [Nocardiopsis flavescens]
MSMGRLPLAVIGAGVLSLLAGGLLVWALRPESVGVDYLASVVLVSWSLPVFGVVATRVLTGRFGDRRALDARVRTALAAHPLQRQLLSLGVFLCCCVALMAVMERVLSDLSLEMGTALTAPADLAARLLFLLALPVLVMDRSGVVLDGRGTRMPPIALKVTEGWRWSGLVPALVTMALLAALVPAPSSPWASPPVVFGVLFSYLLITVSEEVFFRGMVQTRLELMLGRWPGIIGASGLFALFYGAVQPTISLAALPSDEALYRAGLALLTYAPLGLLCGYLWSCFRNTWVNVITRMGLMTIAFPPTL